jgi:hypothetical protein
MMPSRSSIPWLLATVLFVLTTGTAEAQTKSPMADALFREGVALAQKGKFSEAADKFKASYAIDPARGTLQGFALAEEKAGRLAQAMAHFRDLADAAAAAKDAERAKTAREHIASLEPRVPRVALKASGALPEGVQLSLDGTDLPAAAVGSTLPVDPGEHVIRAQAPDGRSIERTFKLAEGEQTSVELKFPQAEQPAPSAPRPSAAPPVSSPPPGRPWWPPTTLGTAGLATGAAGLIAIGVGAGLWVKSGNTYDDLSSRCPQGCLPEHESEINSARTQETAARVLFAVGGVAVAAGVTLFVLGRPDGNKPAPGAAYVGPGTVGFKGVF